MAPIIDTHVHLDEIADPDRAILEAKKAGVTAVVAVGMDLNSNEKVLDFSRRYPGVVYPALGYHPWKVDISGMRATLDFLRNHLDQAVAIGEVGLDYKTAVPREIQEGAFREILELASETGKPLIVHSRLAHEETFQMVRRQGLKKAVFHWYSGPLTILKEILREGYLISATLALRYSPKHREAVGLAPLHRILIETDAPTPYQGEISSPSQVIQTLEELAKLKGLDIEEAAVKTYRNAQTFFGVA